MLGNSRTKVCWYYRKIHSAFPIREAISNEVGTTYKKKDCTETKASVDVRYGHIETHLPEMSDNLQR